MFLYIYLCLFRLILLFVVAFDIRGEDCGHFVNLLNIQVKICSA